MNYEKLMNKKNSNGKDAVDLLNEASDLLDKEDYQGASGLLTEAIRLCGHPRLFFNRGYCCFQLKDTKNAIKDFTKSIANDRGNDLLEHEKQRLYMYLGLIYEENEEDEKAVESYKSSADWGYVSAIARLESMGVTYTPRSKDEPSEHVPEPVSKSKTSSSAGGKASFAKKENPAVKRSLINSPKKKSKLRFILLIAAGFILGAGAVILIQNLPEKVPAKLAVVKASVITDNLYLRAEPYSYAEVLKILKYGSFVDVTGNASDGWTPVEHEGVKGWVDSEFIKQ